MIVTEILAAFDGSACGVAMICTVAGDGGIEGAVYAPAEEIVPHALPEQPAPLTLQAITRLGLELGAGVRVAMKFAASPVFTEAGPVKAREKVLVTVIVPIPFLDGSATLMAVKVTLGGAVSTCGAVYVPVVSTTPQAVPAHPLPERTQVTARLGWPAEFTVAVNGREAPSSTGIVWGETETEMSLVIVTKDDPLVDGSAALVACTFTRSAPGRFAGAV